MDVTRRNWLQGIISFFVGGNVAKVALGATAAAGSSPRERTACWDGRRTTYMYDSSRNLVSVRDSLGSRTTFVYSAMAPVHTLSDADMMRLTTYTYDATGELRRWSR
jgi:uncharacterized protein RhaS with RHS repeats